MGIKKERKKERKEGRIGCWGMLRGAHMSLAKMVPLVLTAVLLLVLSSGLLLQDVHAARCGDGVCQTEDGERW